MWKVMQHRGLRMVFAANMISMLGSGLNAAAVTWHILQATKSEMNLAYLVVLMTIPAMLRNTRPFNTLGFPTISVPCGFTRDGMSVGLQISGPRGAEAVVMGVGNW